MDGMLRPFFVRVLPQNL